MWKKLAKCIGCGIVIVAIGSAGMWLYVAPKFEQQVNRTLVGSLMCFGWPRTGAMTESERELFSKIQGLCENTDATGLNTLLYNEVAAIELSCHPASNAFIEPSAPSINIVVTNASSAPIHFLEFSAKRTNTSSYKQSGQWANDFALISRNEPRFVKTLTPGESFKTPLALSIEGYGKHTVSLSLSTIKWKTLTSKSASMSNPVIARAQCNFEWKPHA